MRKNYEIHDINEMGNPNMFMDKKAHHRFGYQRRIKDATDSNLLNNFFKCAKWVEENCPNLNGKFPCRHEVYHWTRLVVENGKAYLEYGSHGYGFEFALSLTETAYVSTGSCQSKPYAFPNIFFFRNDALEEFLRQWQSIKSDIISTNAIQRKVFSEEFEA